MARRGEGDRLSRKFLKDGKRPPALQRSSVSNASVVSSAAARAKAISVAVDVAAARAREQLAASRELVASTRDQETSAGTIPRLVMADVAVAQEVFSRDASALASQRVTTDAPARAAIDSAVGSLVRSSIVGSFKTARAGGTVQNDAVPELVRIELGFDRLRGTVDGFFSTVVFSVARDDLKSGKVAAFRVFRAEDETPSLLRSYGRLSFAGVSAITSVFARKNFESLSMVEKRLIEGRVSSSLTELLGVDGITGLRMGSTLADVSASFVASSVQQPTTIGGAAATTAAQSFFDAAGIVVDSGVAADLNTIRNIRLQGLAPGVVILNDFVVGGSAVVERDAIDGLRYSQVADLRKRTSVKSTAIVEKPNAQEFRELGVFSVDKLMSMPIGDDVEFALDDSTVMFGRSYRYYVIAIDRSMNESIRTRIGKVAVERLTSPRPPTVVVRPGDYPWVTLSIKSDDLFVERFEVYRKEISADLNDATEYAFSTVNGSDGYVVQAETRGRIGNGYVQVGESSAATDGGSFFMDRTSRVGRKYSYRVYTVDVFGNKSPAPAEIVASVRDMLERSTDLRRPTIIAEIDAATRFARVTMTIDDDRVVGLFMGRRDLTLREKAFVIPTAENHTRLGVVGPTRRLSDQRLYSERDGWTGFFPTRKTGKDVIVFIDTVARLDHTYQYMVYGVDRFGNATSFEVSSPVFISRRPMVRSPINLSANIVSTSGSVTGVSVRWEDGNLDIAPLDRIGSQDDLADTAVRTLFQVERRRGGEERWEQFPMVETSELVDVVSDELAPVYRPTYLKRGATYSYRVAAFQTGSFVSNFTEPVSVKTDLPVIAPENFRIRTTDTKLRPFLVVLNWDTPKGSGQVDRWEVERAVVNSYAAVRLNVRNTAEAGKLPFKQFMSAFRESSRGTARTLDEIGRVSVGPFTGQHHMIDKGVSFGNSYFYRIRAVGVDGTKSDWVVKGIVLKDDVQDRRLDTLLTHDEKTALSIAIAPLAVKARVMK